MPGRRQIHQSKLMYYEAMPGYEPPAFVRLAAHPLRWQLIGELASSDLRVRELVASTGHPQNLVSYHLRLLREAEVVTRQRSSFDARDSYYHLDLDRCADLMAATVAALHPALSSIRTGAPVRPARRPSRLRILFSCTGNSARSPIAEALLRHRTDGAVDVTSAGSDPRGQLHPGAVRVLDQDFGIDVAGQRPRHLDTVASGRPFDYVITLCDKVREVCPEFPGHPRHIHWSIPDPAPEGATERDIAAAVRRTAREIDARIGHLLPVLAAADQRKVEA
jgi:ArsR family transcriptional regulator, arsenate/arsenite/antimonite-responsive transcriptional repressor / arsenate reductase (thioredoxin)